MKKFTLVVAALIITLIANAFIVKATFNDVSIENNITFSDAAYNSKVINSGKNTSKDTQKFIDKNPDSYAVWVTNSKVEYYIMAHDYGAGYSAKIAKVGDKVTFTIDGVSTDYIVDVKTEDIKDYYKADSYLTNVGASDMVIQTCLDDDNLNYYLFLTKTS